MSDLASIFNIATEYEWDGQKYPIVQLNLESIAKYGVWLKDKAMLAVDQIYLNRQDDPRYDRDRKSIIDSVAIGEYDWGSEQSMKSLSTPSGCAKLLELSIFQAGGLITYDEAMKLIMAKQKTMIEAVVKIAGNPKKLSALMDSVAGKPSSQRSQGNRSTRRKKK